VDLVERASPCADYSGVAPYLPVELRAGPDAKALAHGGGNRGLILGGDSRRSAGHGNLLSITLGNIPDAVDSSKAWSPREARAAFLQSFARTGFGFRAVVDPNESVKPLVFDPKDDRWRDRDD
jgi:hypothetical protein